jgi:serine/threonine-protein kinase
MVQAGSVTNWIGQLKVGNHDVAQKLWERYFRRMVGLARKKLKSHPRRALDEEDVALSAFFSLWSGAARGKFPRLRDRHNLWPLLVVLTARKACDVIERDHAQKRGGGKALGESALAGTSPGAKLEELISREPSPEFAVQVMEEYHRLLAGLPEPELKRIALWRMEGFGNEEIAARLGCAVRTVERRLEQIRSLWTGRPAAAAAPRVKKKEASAALPPSLPHLCKAPAGCACLFCLTPLTGAATERAGALTGVCLACRQRIRKHPQPVAGYLIVRPLGQGGMGVVYLALDVAAATPVALKTIAPAVRLTPVQVGRFLREARILQKLRHRHIVGFRAMGESGKLLYFAMDFVRGIDAGRLTKKRGPLSIPHGVRLICQVLEGLAHAHAGGFVHRDIKPSNVLITVEEGRETAKVADFGLARTYQNSTMSGLTMEGELGGTVAFMAPEQVTDFRHARPAADQYATAATLYYLLTGKYVYEFPPTLDGQIRTILEEPCVRLEEHLPEVPAPLADAVHRALAKDPCDRYPDVRQLHKALLPFRG